MVTEFTDSGNHSTLFALQRLMGLDVIPNHVLAPADCHVGVGYVKVLVPFPRDASTNWTWNLSVLDG